MGPGMLRIFSIDDSELASILTNSFVDRSEITLTRCATSEAVLDQLDRSLPDVLIWANDASSESRFDVCTQARSRGVPRVWWLGSAEEVAPATAAGAEQVFVRPLGRSTVLDAIAARIPGLQRRTPRRRARLQVDCFVGERELVGHTRDLGVNGAFIRSVETVPPGAGLQVIFDLPDRYDKTIRADARVIRAVPADGDSYSLPGIGVEFLRMGGRDRSELARYVADSVEGP
jgi:hypothetical protein